MMPYSDIKALGLELAQTRQHLCRAMRALAFLLILFTFHAVWSKHLLIETGAGDAGGKSLTDPV